MEAPEPQYEGKLSPELEDVAYAAVMAADRIAHSRKGWRRARTSWLIFYKMSSYAWARDTTGFPLYKEWFVYVKGSRGLWLGQDGWLYRKIASSGRPRFDRVDYSTAATQYNLGLPKLIYDLNSIQP